MTTDTPRVRANSNGHPCPPWCIIDHVADVGGGHRYIFHGGDNAKVEVPGKMRHADDAICVRAIHGGDPRDHAVISLAATRLGVDEHSSSAWIDPREAEALAVIIEMLAKASPARHRELAAAIRQVAADITGPAVKGDGNSEQEQD